MKWPKWPRITTLYTRGVIGPGVVRWTYGRTWSVPTTPLSTSASLWRGPGGRVATKRRPSATRARLAGRAVHRARQCRLRLSAGARRRRSRHRHVTGALVTSSTRWLTDPDIVTAGELQAVIMACLYVAFSYVGCEISYPLKVWLRLSRRYLMRTFFTLTHTGHINLMTYWCVWSAEIAVICPVNVIIIIIRHRRRRHHRHHCRRRYSLACGRGGGIAAAHPRFPKKYYKILFCAPKIKETLFLTAIILRYA